MTQTPMEDAKQKVKDQILHLLKRHGPQTATALAQDLDISAMAVRQHLQTLKAEAWVSYQQERRPVGRPVKLWQLTEQTNGRFPDAHAELMVDFLRGVEVVFGTEGLDRLVAERSTRQIQTYQTRLEEMQADSWPQRVEAIAHLRSQEGYMAEVIQAAENELLLVENHCPICAAAQTCQGFCGAELDVFRSVLGDGVTVERVEHILQGDRRCAYRITPTEPITIRE